MVPLKLRTLNSIAELREVAPAWDDLWQRSNVLLPTMKAELLAETRSDMSAELIAHAWKRIIFTSEIPRVSVQAFVVNSQKAGFMKTAPDISRLFETP